MPHPNHHVHPRHPDHLRGSRWSRVGGDLEYRHWEVDVLHKRAGEVELRAALDRAARLLIPWRSLRDRSQWEPGWTRGDGDGAPQPGADADEDAPTP